VHFRVDCHFFQLKEMADKKRLKAGCMVVYQASGGFLKII
jgi:hypothetical protein